jgi:hypothetical protein
MNMNLEKRNTYLNGYGKWGNEKYLNKLTDQYVKPNRTLYVMELIAKHDVKSFDELAMLIDYHHTNYKYDEVCPVCKQRSKATIEQVAKLAYNAQNKNHEQYAEYEKVLAYVYDAMVVRITEGAIMENKAIADLKAIYSDYRIDKVNSKGESKAVDIKIKSARGNKYLLQVKSNTYTNHDNTQLKQSDIQKHNQIRALGIPVEFLYYDVNIGEFDNLQQIVDLIKEEPYNYFDDVVPVTNISTFSDDDIEFFKANGLM